MTDAPRAGGASGVDPRERFTGLAALYQRNRPSYPEPLFDWLIALFAPQAPRRVLDVGCGTGISSRLLAARGLDVVGVDPNEDMLAAARAAGGNVRYVRGSADATGAADASVDLVTVAQAFHWLDAAKAHVEFKRVLRPGGWCAAWWNDRTSSALNDAYESLLREHCADYVRQVDDETASFRDDRFVRDLRHASFANAQRLDREGYVGRVASSSYVRHGLLRGDEFFRAIDALFARHAVAGVVEIRYECRVWAWREAGCAGST